MDRTGDVIVIGGGVTGLSTAVHLKLRGVERVLVLERHNIGSGQSGRAGGVVRALVRHPGLAHWQLYAQGFFQELNQRFGESLDVHRAGYLLVTTPDQETAAEEAVATALQVGADARRIDAAEAQQLQPGLRSEAGAVYAFEPGGIHVDPMPATQALARIATRLGVQIHEGVEVGHILVRGQAVRGVESSQGRFATSEVLVATSNWGRAQLAQLGVDVPVYPHRAEMAFFQVSPAGQHRLARILSDSVSQLYLRPEGEEQMFVGWREGDLIGNVEDLVEQDPDNYKQTAHFQSLRHMHQRLALTLPFMKDGFAHRTYACVYDYTPDGMPILDGVETIDGLYYALGYSGGGFSLSPWVGWMMADFIVDHSKPEEIELLGLSRSAEGRLIDWSNVAPPAQSR